MDERTTDVRAAERRLERARAELKQAMSRLATVRRAALHGDHDADALDEAVLRTREAQANVRAARQELEREWASALEESAPVVKTAAQPGNEPSPDAVTTEPELAPLEITPRLLFARWLVQTGRLTEEISEQVLTPAAA